MQVNRLRFMVCGQILLFCNGDRGAYRGSIMILNLQGVPKEKAIT
jgi:hypothetical protein